MKKIWQYLVAHLREDFNKTQYAIVAVFITAALIVNYTFNFDDVVLKSQQGFKRFFYYFIFYCVAYYFTLLVGKRQFLRQRSFWLKSLVGLAALSLDSSAPWLRDWILDTFEPGLQLWSYKVIINLVGVFTVVLPVLIVYYFYDRKEKHWYGLSPQRFDYKPYLYMLLIMLPILISASFFPGFIKQYPMYRDSPASALLGVPEWVTIAIYEFAYGFDFITVEFLFRGFFVIGMIKVLGRQAVLPMAITYCFLHTGKPLGEAISSIFGGYLLGVIAYETRSVWGGVIVHVGIAWMMEIIGGIGKVVRGW